VPTRSTYVEAVGIYEQALRTFQQQNYSKAADLFHHVLKAFPEERELLDRVRLYVTLCERHLTPLMAEPRNTQERLYAATLALNAGDLGSAISHLERVRRDEPGNDQALYMLAVAHAQREEPAVAIPYLEQAIEANAENRALARFDPELELLREEDAVIALLEAPAVARTTEHKRIARRK
jgi:outer membrane protein assembly factor BamD (BamD/ComL family)